MDYCLCSLCRLLKSSHSLKLLDLRGSGQVTVQGIQQLPVTDLQHLFLSQSSIAKYDGIEVIVQKVKVNQCLYTTSFIIRLLSIQNIILLRTLKHTCIVGYVVVAA